MTGKQWFARQKKEQIAQLTCQLDALLPGIFGAMPSAKTIQMTSNLSNYPSTQKSEGSTRRILMLQMT